MARCNRGTCNQGFVAPALGRGTAGMQEPAALPRMAGEVIQIPPERIFGEYAPKDWYRIIGCHTENGRKW